MDIYEYFKIPRGDLRALMEAVKRECGWSEMAARIADGDEMRKALSDKMQKETSNG